MRGSSGDGLNGIAAVPRGQVFCHGCSKGTVFPGDRHFGGFQKGSRGTDTLERGWVARAILEDHGMTST